MATAATARPPTAGLATLADLLDRLGDLPPERVRLHPAPGTATQRDVLEVHRRERRLCELVAGTLVEKTMGYEESSLASLISTYLNVFLETHNLGVVAGADGMMRLTTGLLRIPDVSFISWDRLPDRRRPKGPVPRLAIDLAVEVLSKGNPRSEVERKLSEYFEAGVRLVWLVDPRRKTIRVHTAPRRSVLLREADGVLDGGEVLPGFRLPLRELFARAARSADS